MTNLQLFLTVWLCLGILAYLVILGGTKTDELENNEIYLPENDNHETRN